MKHSFVRYVGCVHIASQKIRQIQAYHRKAYCDFTIQRCYSSQQINVFVIQSCKQELLGWFFPSFYI